MDSSRHEAPLQGRYWLTALFVALALLPDLLLSTGLQLARPSIAQSLGVSASAIALGETLSNAGWAFGAVLASFLALRFPGYLLNVIYLAGFIAGSACGALAPSVGWEIAGRVLQGTATGMLLISTLPPLIRAFPESRLRTTATIIDVAFFGGVAAGPLIGGYVAVTGTWRLLFVVVGAMSCVSFALAWLVVERRGGFNPEFPLEPWTIGLALAGALLTFIGIGFIESGGWMQPRVWIPAVAGLLCIAVLIVYQYRAKDGLMPVKPLSTTYPLMGILTGIIGGLAFTAVASVALLALTSLQGLSPLGAGIIFWPALLAAMVAALVFGALFNTRYVLLLPAIGLVALIAGSGLLLAARGGGGIGNYLWITGLMGLGAGLTVAPGLFMASLSVRPQLVGRAFALVELLRLAGAYAFVPAFTYLATVNGATGAGLASGVRSVGVVTLGILLATLVVATTIFFVGGARIHAPDLQAYLNENQTALDSPPMVGNENRPHARETLGAAFRSAVEPFGDSGATPEERPHDADQQSEDQRPRNTQRHDPTPA